MSIRKDDGMTRDAACLRDEGEVQPLLQQIGRTLTAFKQVYSAELGVSALGAWILSLLCRHDGLTQNDLTSRMHVDASMITRTVKELESERGWISRERDPRDNRLVRVYLTPEGRERAYGLREQVSAIEQRLSRDLNSEQIEQLRGLLRTLEDTARRDHEQLTTGTREAQTD
ncbi:MAG: MarR family transcriptional regulator [Chloroflexota bacterium]|nr:MarR family transcriptional regulator [Chloroflexota bacterium]